eukprot:642370_1
MSSFASNLTCPAIASCGLAIVFIIVILFDICTQIPRWYNAESSSTQTKRYIWTFIYSDLFIILTCIVSATLVLLFEPDEMVCTWMTRLWFLSFHTNRCIQYMISLQRMIIMYSDTIVPSRIHTHKYFIWILITIYAIIYVIIPLSESYLSAIPLISIDTNGCAFQYGPFIFHHFAFQYTSSIFHIFMIIYLLHLFMNPLRKLINIHLDNQQMDHQLIAVMVKYCILHSCSIVSALLFITFCVLFPSMGYNYSILDAFINGIVLILLNPIHNTIYKHLCCFLRPFCKVCIKTTDINDHVQKQKPTMMVTRCTTDRNTTPTDIDCGNKTPTTPQSSTPSPKSPFTMETMVCKTPPSQQLETAVSIEQAMALEFTVLDHDRHRTMTNKVHLPTLSSLDSLPCAEMIDFKSYQRSTPGSPEMTEQEFKHKSTRTIQLLKVLSTNL